MDHMSGFDIRLVFTLPPVTIHCSTKEAYTSEIPFLALNPCQNLFPRKIIAEIVQKIQVTIKLFIKYEFI